MQNLQKRFQKWHDKFQAKQDTFQKLVDKYQAAGSTRYYNHYRTLLEQEKNLARELHATLQKGGEFDRRAVAYSIKRFKKIYKELHEASKGFIRQWIEAIVVAGLAVLILRNFIFGLYHVPTGSAEPTLLVGDRVWGNRLAYRLGAKPQRGEYIMLEDPMFKYDRHNSINYYWQKYVGIPVPLLGLGGGPEAWTKRVIAVPGDTIEGRVIEGKTHVYLNGEELDEQYLNPYPLIGLEKTSGFIDLDAVGPLMVPSFLRKQTKPVFYTYDPDKDFSEQPFYNMNSSELVFKPGTFQRWLKEPRDPSRGASGKIIDEYGPFTVPAGKYWVMGDSRRNSGDSRIWGFLDEDLIQGRASFIIYSIDSEESFWLFELIKHPIDFWRKSVRWNRFFKGLSSNNQKH